MKPSLPQGTRDFDAEILRKRYYIIDTIKRYFELYGFEPLETPAMENLDTLLGKYGDEGDKLVFKVLNNGLDNESKRAATLAAFDNILRGKNDRNITSRALKYDLTIPFARYVAMNYNLLAIPFKRYQVQPVWRADRPQKGRYREFYQCDADVAGTFSLKADAEFALLYRDVFKALKIPVRIKLNNRKILSAVAEISGGAEKFRMITTAIDKLDKTGLESVKKELANNGLSAKNIGTIESYLSVSGNPSGIIDSLQQILKDSDAGREGIADLVTIFQYLGDDHTFSIDPTLARGLDYYTGTIYEISAQGVNIGSIGGGGRYDDLTGLFGVKNVPGVGISFGIDRIYDVMEELNLFPDSLTFTSQVLFFNLGEKESDYAFQLMMGCREQGIACELYYEKVKLDKQFKYADKKRIPFVVIIGSKEMEEGTCKIKQLSTGEEKTINSGNLCELLRKKFIFKNLSSV